MAHIVEMPKLSDTMEEGGIAHWLKKEGDAVKIGEPLVEIETDKATQEYEAPEDGFVLKILVPQGKTVSLRTPIAVIGEKGETFDVGSLAKGGGAAPAKAAPPSQPPAASKPAQAASAPSTSRPAPTLSPPVSPTPNVAVGQSRLGESEGRVKSSPLARKIASERGIDLAEVSGSGPMGRVVARDLDLVGTNTSSSIHGALNAPIVQHQKVTEVPVSMMRKTIAKRLVQAKNEAPHFYLKVSADVGELLKWRQRINQNAGSSGSKTESPKVSVNDLVALAVSRALLQHPMVNASWQQDTIVMHHEVHLALAVALPNGLVTPVIRNAHRLGVKGLAAEAQALVAKARDGKLGNDAYQGGTFSISNLGMFGIEEFTAIINPPQAAILAVGAAMATPWVSKTGEIVVKERLNLTLSCDHRVVDGATGAQFLKTLVQYLEDPLQILL